MYIARTAKNEGEKSEIIETEWNGGCRSGGRGEADGEGR